LKPGVWIHTSWRVLGDGTRFPSNGLLVKDGEALALVDTAWGERPTEELLDWVARELRRPVVRAVVTHFHDDRMGGASVLAARGIPFFGHPSTRALAGKKPGPLPEALEGVAEVGETVRVGPLEVLFPGPAHTLDNVAVFLPEAKVLFGGCAVKSLDAKTLGNVADADLPSWPSAIRRLQQAFPGAEVVVPGHGAEGGPELLAHTLALLEIRR
jgi:metallo-beta-lactamase class B VIM